MFRVSVIIPVYNAEKYLRRCLDSVCKQTLKDMEIICVNDCSTDNSLDILNEYAQKYPQLKIVDCKENRGEAAARNIGLENAAGEYVGFVDNDDEIDLDFYEKLYLSAKEKNADIAKGEVHIINYDGEEIYGNLNQEMRENNSILYFAYHWWTAIFKLSIIKENNIHFLEGYPLGGDVLFLNNVVLASDTFSLVDSVFYHYHRRKDSGDSDILPFEKIKSALTIHEMIVDNVLQSPRFNTFPPLALNFLFSWLLAGTLVYCFRYRSIEVLDFCIEKTFAIYKKVAPYLPKKIPSIGLDRMNILKNGDENQLKRYIIKSESPRKKLLTYLRNLHTE